MSESSFNDQPYKRRERFSFEAFDALVGGPVEEADRWSVRTQALRDFEGLAWYTYGLGKIACAEAEEAIALFEAWINGESTSGDISGVDVDEL